MISAQRVTFQAVRFLFVITKLERTPNTNANLFVFFSLIRNFALSNVNRYDYGSNHFEQITDDDLRVF